MLFPTVRFAIFFALVLPTSWLLAHKRTRWRVFILIASYAFYGNWDWRFVFLLAGSTVANHLAAQGIHASRTERTRGIVLGVAVAGNLALLGWFKYYDFFVTSATNLLSPIGINWNAPLRSLVLPVGISFITFQAMSYVLDTYRRQVEPTSFLDFAVYLSFFPHLVAGPIVRASEFLPQLKTRLDPRRVDVGLAFWLIAMGLFKKVVISSYLSSTIVDPVFAFPRNYGTFDTMLAIYGYAVQIYADFSGYTDMAIGLALLLGFQFPKNFDSPYAAVSLQDFWRRWHMTLSRWLRDYLYIPLGGNRRGRVRGYVNLALTMILGGLWHGAAWTFVAWGTLHGVGLAYERWRADRRPADADAEPAVAPPPVGLEPGAVASAGAGSVMSGIQVETAEQPAPTAGPAASTVLGNVDWKMWRGRLITFHLVCLGWVFFRAPTFTGAFDVLGRLAHVGTTSAFNPVLVLVIVGSIAVQFIPQEPFGAVQAWFSRQAWWAQSLLLSSWIVMCTVFGPIGVAPFIYFQF